MPSSAARIALEIRFFQRMGIEVGGATSIGLVDSVSGFTIQILLIVIIMATGLAGTLDTSGGSSSGSGGSSGSSSHVWVLLVALLLAAIIIGLAVPRYRATIKEAWPRYRAKIRDQRSEAAVALRVLRHPKKIALLFGGNLAAQVLLAIILGMCLKAFGHSATLAQLILVNTFVSLFAGFMPVPGGMGVAEAGYTAGLGGHRDPQRRGHVHGDRVQVRDVLPPADLGGVRDAMAPTTLVRLRRGHGPRLTERGSKNWSRTHRTSCDVLVGSP